MSEAKPGPRITAINRPFWESCNEDRLLLQRCRTETCGKWVYFPRVCCPHCGGGELAWEEASGQGEIVTFTIVRRPQHPSFLPEAPYVFAAIRLAEGPLMYSRVVGVTGEEPSLLGAAVAAVFVQHGPGQKLPFFAVARARSTIR